MRFLLGGGGSGHQSTLPSSRAPPVSLSMTVAVWLSNGGGTAASAAPTQIQWRAERSAAAGELRRSSHASALRPRGVVTRSNTRLNRARPVERPACLAQFSGSGRRTVYDIGYEVDNSNKGNASIIRNQEKQIEEYSST
ncbi:hypothetical protein SETIT_3G284900v2 [Setaria italica]|uniref:Uncharacterized protein n=1 Tax=Setaria italica TaxID=4555 RepID=A0A368QJV6_SETIT|nr:hypothetical protein SETIT_3G284900v2 [Setaria italica]